MPRGTLSSERSPFSALEEVCLKIETKRSKGVGRWLGGRSVRIAFRLAWLRPIGFFVQEITKRCALEERHKGGEVELHERLYDCTLARKDPERLTQDRASLRVGRGASIPDRGWSLRLERGVLRPWGD